MDWFDRLLGRTEKQQTGMVYSRNSFGDGETTSDKLKVSQGYGGVEAVNRGINMVVDDCSDLNFLLDGKFNDDKKYRIPVKHIQRVINLEPNPYQDISAFRRNLIMDFLIDGNIFIYFDGTNMYRLPAKDVTINDHPTEYITSYSYDTVEYAPSEIIHVKENSMGDNYRGISRLRASQDTMRSIVNMKKFQSDFFANSAILGLVIETDNVLSEKHKDRLLEGWANRYKPGDGGKRPIILDGGLTVKKLTESNLREMDFQEAQQIASKIILEAIGVPHALVSSGTNNTVRPNMRLYYLETVLPIANKIKSAYERFFNHRLKVDISDVPALQPELREEAQYYATLVNGGIFKPNEAREGLNKEPDDDPAMDQIRVPANIAGSAADPSEGGRPSEEEEE